jgi:hypothetical protein
MIPEEKLPFSIVFLLNITYARSLLQSIVINNTRMHCNFSAPVVLIITLDAPYNSKADFLWGWGG